jgi:hypothetical protein
MTMRAVEAVSGADAAGIALPTYRSVTTLTSHITTALASVSKETPQADRISRLEVFGVDALIEASNTCKRAAVFGSLDAAVHGIQPSL